MRTVKSDTGYSLTETMISTALTGIVMIGAFDLHISTSNSILAQTNAVQMQAEVKAAMDYMVREMRLMSGLPTLSTSLTADDTISFTRVEGSGYSSGGNTVSTLWDTSKSWTPGAFAPTSSGAYSVMVLLGSGVGETHPLKGNTASTLTLADTDTWTTIPDTSSLYLIVRTKTFTLNPDSTLRYQIESGPRNLLASNITALSFSQPDPMSVGITMTVRSETIDPRIGNYLYYTLTDTVRRRN